MAMNVEIKDAGIDTNTMNALRKLCKNKIITKATKKTANSKSWNTASTA